MTRVCARPDASPRSCGHSGRRRRCQRAPQRWFPGPGQAGGGSAGGVVLDLPAAWGVLDLQTAAQSTHPLSQVGTASPQTAAERGCRGFSGPCTPRPRGCGLETRRPFARAAARDPTAHAPSSQTRTRWPRPESVVRGRAGAAVGAPGRSSQVTQPSPVIGTCSGGGFSVLLGTGGGRQIYAEHKGTVRRWRLPRGV